MFAFLRGVFWGALLIGAGWFVGSAYPAPAPWTAAFKQRSDVVVAKLDLSPAGVQRLRASLTGEEFSKLTQDAAHLASASGQAVAVERFTDDEQHVDSDQSAPTPVAPRQTRRAFRLPRLPLFRPCRQPAALKPRFRCAQA